MTTLTTVYTSRKARTACGQREISTTWLSLLSTSDQVTHQSNGNHRKSEFKAYTPCTYVRTWGSGLVIFWYSSQSIHS